MQLVGLGERCKLPQRGLGRSPSRNWISRRGTHGAPPDLLTLWNRAIFKSQNAPNSKFSRLHRSPHWETSQCSSHLLAGGDGAIFKSQNAPNSKFFGPVGGAYTPPNLLAHGCPTFLTIGPMVKKVGHHRAKYTNFKLAAGQISNFTTNKTQ